MKKMILSLCLGGSILMANQQLDIINTIDIKTPKKIEPSGLTMTNEGQLLIVSDNGRLCKLQNEYLDCTKIKKGDYEGIAYFNDTIFIAEEGNDNLLAFNKKLDLISKMDIPRVYKSEKVLDKESKNGIEGLSFLYEKDNRLYFSILNQSKKLFVEDSSAVIIISVDKSLKKDAQIEDIIKLGIKDLSGNFYYKGSLFVISDKTNILIELNLDTKEILNTYDLPGDGQEGIYIENNKLYIAEDSGNLKIYTLKKELK